MQVGGRRASWVISGHPERIAGADEIWRVVLARPELVTSVRLPVVLAMMISVPAACWRGGRPAPRGPLPMRPGPRGALCPVSAASQCRPTDQGDAERDRPHQWGQHGEELEGEHGDPATTRLKMVMLVPKAPAALACRARLATASARASMPPTSMSGAAAPPRTRMMSGLGSGSEPKIMPPGISACSRLPTAMQAGDRRRCDGQRAGR